MINASKSSEIMQTKAQTALKAVFHTAAHGMRTIFLDAPDVVIKRFSRSSGSLDSDATDVLHLLNQKFTADAVPKDCRTMNFCARNFSYFSST